MLAKGSLSRRLSMVAYYQECLRMKVQHRQHSMPALSCQWSGDMEVVLESAQNSVLPISGHQDKET